MATGVWWYSIGDKRSGSFTAEEMQAAVLTGKINSSTLVWKEGMEKWLPLKDVEDIKHILDSVPPPLPSEDDIDPLSYPQATRWPRFFARMFDVWWTTILLGLGVGYVLGRTSAGYVEWINQPGSEQLFGIMCLPFALVLDAAIYSIAGNTPGKALLRLKVLDIRGGQITFLNYLMRNLRMWRSGLALGIPLFNLITMAMQSRRIVKGEPASYDVESMHRVRAIPSGAGRKVVFAMVFVGMLGGMSVLNVAGQKVESEVIKAKYAKPYQWVNADTKMAVSIDGDWIQKSTDGGNGISWPMFTTATEHAAVIIAHEEFPSRSIHEYVQALAVGMSNLILFDDGGSSEIYIGTPSWTLTGRLAESPNDTRVKIQVYQVGNRYWRLVSIQSVPYDYTNAQVQKLETTLRSSFMRTGT